jgi:hypothetical protein
MLVAKGQGICCERHSEYSFVDGWGFVDLCSQNGPVVSIRKRKQIRYYTAPRLSSMPRLSTLSTTKIDYACVTLTDSANPLARMPMPMPPILKMSRCHWHLLAHQFIESNSHKVSCIVCAISHKITHCMCHLTQDRASHAPLLR